MAKRIYIALFLLGLFMTGESITMDKEKTGSQSGEMTEKEKADNEMAHKMMLLKQHMKNQGVEQPDVRAHIGQTLNALHAASQNPVFNATMEFRDYDTNKGFSFKIGEKVKNGMIDLSDPAFGDTGKYLVITTDPSVFLAPHDQKLVILIAPWSLIHDNLKTSTAIFEPIMKTWDQAKEFIGHFPMLKSWDQTKAPIGIFWRDGDARPTLHYMDYLINAPISELNGKSLYKWWEIMIAGLSSDSYRSDSSEGKRRMHRFKCNFELK